MREEAKDVVGIIVAGKLLQDNLAVSRGGRKGGREGGREGGSEGKLGLGEEAEDVVGVVVTGDRSRMIVPCLSTHRKISFEVV